MMTGINHSLSLGWTVKEQCVCFLWLSRAEQVYGYQASPRSPSPLKSRIQQPKTIISIWAWNSSLPFTCRARDLICVARNQLESTSSNILPWMYCHGEYMILYGPFVSVLHCLKTEPDVMFCIRVTFSEKTAWQDFSIPKSDVIINKHSQNPAKVRQWLINIAKIVN
jgi:hypothetical protein